MSEDRRKKVLGAIVKHFIQTAEPVGSQTILVSYHFHVSPATIRNDMMTLEDQGYLFQPHTSAGRVPTDKGYRAFVDEMADYESAKEQALATLKKVQLEYKTQKIRESLYDSVSLLARATNLASFATTPDNPRTFFLGMSNVLRQPEFAGDTVHASEVIEVLEKGDNFVKTLASLEIDKFVKAFIGEENILPQIQSCSILVTKYSKAGFEGYIGLLGPKRMNYPFNIVILEEVRNLLDN
ncbi:MAG: DeoR family transcriptional regulator [Candidatus Gracilibacteria bacterium]|nr:DeoR family transcriptional regulator [Candidatus Gracilibacteria bacterium]